MSIAVIAGGRGAAVGLAAICARFLASVDAPELAKLLAAAP
jgi:hypothetical protein